MPHTTCHMSISLDGFVAGPGQSAEHPLGKRGHDLHRWHMGDERATEADARAADWLMGSRGAYVMGRNMFGPIRGDWPDAEWKGWWGDNPPYHVPVFVLTHHERPSITMAGGTVFHFVTEGFEAALDRARDAAGHRDIRIGGGVATIRQYLKARLIDEMHLAVTPVLLGGGESLFAGIDLPRLGYQVSRYTGGDGAAHMIVSRS